MKPESYKKIREKKKILRKELSGLVKKLPADVLEHYAHLMRMEANALLLKQKK